MTPFWRPDQPHFLVRQYYAIDPNPVAFPIRSGPHKDHKNNYSPFRNINVPISGYASQAHMGRPPDIASQIIPIISS